MMEKSARNSASSTECKMSREMTNARGIQNTKEQIFLETLMRAPPRLFAQSLAWLPQVPDDGEAMPGAVE